MGDTKNIATKDLFMKNEEKTYTTLGKCLYL
jgi:hypothetical protein